ncbi:MAG: hypothetical protein K9G33_10425 [Sneathiella sp.]|nr:hypothetical protein [Sneathiella sp.]
MERAPLEYPRKTKLEQTEVICPEGLWVPQAGIQLLQKENPEGWGKLYEMDAARRLVHLLLTTPELEAFSISSHFGTKEPIEQDYLRSKNSVPDFVRGCRRLDSHYDRTAAAYYFVNKSQFEDFLAGRPIVDPSEIRQSGDMRPSYIPPYMQFMLDAVRSLNLSQEKRTGKSVIVEWLKDNWPNDLDGKSDRMIQSMATMLRSPEHKKGGNTSWKE